MGRLIEDKTLNGYYNFMIRKSQYYKNITASSDWKMTWENNKILVRLKQLLSFPYGIDNGYILLVDGLDDFGFELLSHDVKKIGEVFNKIVDGITYKELKKLGFKKSKNAR